MLYQNSAKSQNQSVGLAQDCWRSQLPAVREYLRQGCADRKKASMKFDLNTPHVITRKILLRTSFTTICGELKRAFRVGDRTLGSQSRESKQTAQGTGIPGILCTKSSSRPTRRVTSQAQLDNTACSYFVRQNKKQTCFEPAAHASVFTYVG